MTNNHTRSVRPTFIAGVLANCSYWGNMLDEADAGLNARLFREQENLAKAIEMALLFEQTQKRGVTLLLDLFIYLETWGNWQKWLSLYQVAQNAVSSDVQLVGQLLNRIGYLQRILHTLDVAHETHIAALQIGQEMDDLHIITSAEFNLCEVLRLLHRYQDAETYGRQALTRLKEHDQKDQFESLTASLHVALGLVARALGDKDLEVSHFQQGCAYWEILNRPTQLARTMHNLAEALIRQGRYQEAEQALIEAKHILQASNSENDKVRILNGLGILKYNQGQFTVAEEFFREAQQQAHLREISPALQATTLQNLGNVLVEQKKYGMADPWLLRAERQWYRLQNELELANTLGTLGRAKLGANQENVAKYYLEEATKILQGLPSSRYAEVVKQEVQAALDQLLGS